MGLQEGTARIAGERWLHAARCSWQSGSACSLPGAHGSAGALPCSAPTAYPWSRSTLTHHVDQGRGHTASDACVFQAAVDPKRKERFYASGTWHSW